LTVKKTEVLSWGQCYEFKNIFAEETGTNCDLTKIKTVWAEKLSQYCAFEEIRQFFFAKNNDHNTDPRIAMKAAVADELRLDPNLDQDYLHKKMD
jgi:hypothetical protein